MASLDALHGVLDLESPSQERREDALIFWVLHLPKSLPAPIVHLRPGQPHQNSNPNIPRTLPALIAQSLSACEPDLRTILLSNVVLCGGGSLFAGLADRLHNELARNFPHVSFVFTIRVDEIRGII